MSLVAKKAAISIKDIARAANVSHSTVSRALRDSSLVNHETAERIRRIARDSNFRVSAVARGLATGRTSTIGVVVTAIGDPFNAEVVESIEEAANARGYSVALANSGANPDREMKVVQSFEERRVDGIIVMSSRVGALYVTHLTKMAVPVVLINNQHPGEFVYSVMIDNVPASEAATRYLIQLGHRRIAYFGRRGGFQADTERFAGYRKALEAAGLPVLDELVVRGESTPEGGMRAMQQLLDLPDPPTALFCYNDTSAIGAMRAARLRSLWVPGDISIMGFDDLAIASYVDPPLTTVRQPKRHMGRIATEILCNLLNGSKSESSRRLQGELIVRESTAPPKRRARSSAQHYRLIRPRSPAKSRGIV